MCDVDIALRNALMVGENYHSFENHSLPFGTNDLDDLLIKHNNLSSDANLTHIPGYDLSRVIFDATWAVILALNNSMQALAENGLSLEGAVNRNGVNQQISNIMKESLNQVQFFGLSVIISSAIFDNFYNELDTLMSQSNSSISPIVLGSPFSFVSEYTVDVLGKYQNFFQVNFKSSLAKLNNSPFFYRIGPNEEFFNVVRLEMVLNYNWKRIGILSSSGMFSSTAEDLEQKLKSLEMDITVINTASFVTEGTLNKNIQNHLSCLKENDIRIIFALVTVIEIPLIMCAAYDIGLINDYHLWILPEINLNDIRRVAKQYNMCDVDIALRNALMVGENYDHSFENHSLPFGTNDLDDLLIKYNNLSSDTNLTHIPGYNLSRVIFDATWAVILALNNSMQMLAEKGLSLEGAVNQNGVDQQISNIIKESLNQIQFFGLSGIVDFSNKGNNNSFMTSGTFDSARISQIINKSPCSVKIYQAINETTLVSHSGSCNFRGIIINYPEVPSALLIFTIVISVMFILVSIVLAVFIIAMRKNEYIKTSGLTLSLVIIVGCGLVLLSSIPRLLTFGAEHYDIDETQFNALCQVGFSLDTFGWNLVCVFIYLKSWRLYRIQNNKSLRKKIRFISEKAIFVVMLILLSPTVIMFIPQVMFDRLIHVTKEVTTEDESYEYSFCEPQNLRVFWITVFSIYNLLIIIISLWQAWHVSQLTIKRLAFLEGRLSVHLLLTLTVSTLCLVAVELILNNEEAYDVAIIFRTVESMCFSVITISMIFLPKIYLILKKTGKPASKNPHSSSGNSSGKTERTIVVL